MRVALNDLDDRAGLRGFVQFNKYTYTHTNLGRSMRVALNDLDDRAGMRGYVQFNKYTHTHWEDQCEWHRMTRLG